MTMPCPMISRRPSARRRPRRSASCSTITASRPRSVAPRHWEHAHGIDGPVTSNNAADRKWAIERGKRTCDVARVLGTDRFVWWPAREGTYIRESKDAVTSLRAHARVRRHDSRLRQEHPHPRRDEAQRADGPDVPADHRPFPGAGVQEPRPEPRRRADRIGPRDPRRARSRPTNSPTRCSTRSSGACTSTTRTA